MRAVNLGDTTGAVCGQLAGAYWGESRILGRMARWNSKAGDDREGPSKAAGRQAMMEKTHEPCVAGDRHVVRRGCCE